ncbi:hypothetical protein [Flammeovirga sp. SJP92]|uniref:hypothetical protein n=1 Tax=Flammeovirga sp. SJP92 TaxID=1775430 RepID=UPI000787066B|nr:hypothetical protein [Flammeovirga sp. SJP92]KXX67798.1 hypothetical protein AVL50_25385 [Flammeovirga sp. SJP92]
MIYYFKNYPQLKRGIAFFLLFNFLQFILLPNSTYALTSGPSQPEIQSFQAIGTSDMVDLFSGDFSYNIPLFELPGPNGGYPFNLSYSGGNSVDQEASWVGLGWSLSPGAITRQVRGIPDDFKGDAVIKQVSMKPDQTIGLGVTGSLEFAGVNLPKSVALSGTVGLFYNNYRGPGLDISAGVNFKTGSLGMGLNLGVGSQDGVSISPSIGLNYKKNDSEYSLNGGFTYNSLRGATGLQLTTDVTKYSTVHRTVKSKTGHKMSELGETSYSVGASTPISFAHSGFMPSIGIPQKGLGFTFKAKTGVSLFTIFGNATVQGNYNRIEYGDGENLVPSYGAYYHHESTNAGEVLVDFNREKDGILKNGMTNLAMPHFTSDIYNVTGQGNGGMFRAKLDYIPFLGDPELKSETIYGTLGIDLGAFKFGANGTLLYGDKVARRWSEKVNEIQDTNKVGKSNFKMFGEETTIDQLSSDYDNVVDINSKSKFRTQSNLLSSSQAPSNLPVIAIPNSFLKHDNSSRDYNVTLIEENSNETDFVRGGEDHHIGAFQTTNQNGVRYIYALPAYNHESENYTFNVNEQSLGNMTGTVDISSMSMSGEDLNIKDLPGDRFFEKTITPSHTYAHLLTAILGNDYVDVDNNGPSENDLGYWVKFSYTKHASNYKWRSPYDATTANYSPGSISNKKDDKGIVVYGEKEIYYLSKVETATHIAKFILSPRLDGREAAGRFLKSLPNNQTLGDQLKLDRIDLYTRQDQKTPVKSVHFNYKKNNSANDAYDLCYGTPNSSASTKGKLSLHSLHFTYGNTHKSFLNPYIFEYNTDTEWVYNQESQDRWGTFRKLSNDLASLFFPYTEQTADKEKLDDFAGAWSLSKITLPSGAKMYINYEIDDYAYVQDLPAMEMVNIHSTSSNNDLDDYTKIVVDLPNVKSQEDALLLLDFDEKGEAQVAFTAMMDIGVGGGRWKDIHGYAKISKDKCKYNTDSKKVELELQTIDGYHPFSMAAWQYVQKSEPNLLGTSSMFDDTDPSQQAILSGAFGIVGLLEQIVRAIQGFYNYCKTRKIGTYIMPKYSFVRLNSLKEMDGKLTLKKYGGGHRVSQIALHDDWDEWNGSSDPLYYGQIYQYKTYNVDTEKWESSGVASYEPQMGGEEIPQRKGLVNKDLIPLRNNEYSTFELPINENYHPGPMVGYSRVDVIDLASAKAYEGAGNENLLQMVKGRTIDGTEKKPFDAVSVPFKRSKVGKQVHEFYTAKDYPVITNQTPIRVNDSGREFVTAVLYYQESRTLDASQGYSIELNNMHGKQKKVSFYPQYEDGTFYSSPISWTEYIYQDDFKNGKRLPLSEVECLTLSGKDNTIASNVEKRTKGVEVDMFIDSRFYESETYTTGVDFNVDVLQLLFAPIPVISVLPDISRDYEKTTSLITNKIIHRSGILEKVKSYSEGALSEVHHKYYDSKTGEVLVKMNTTQFWDQKSEPSAEKKLYSLSVPGYYKYPTMGQGEIASSAIYTGGLKKLETSTLSGEVNPNPNYYELEIDQNIELIKGDEFIMKPAEASAVSVMKFIYVGETKIGLPVVEVMNPVLEESYSGSFQHVRSGNRNILSATASSYISRDPSMSIDKADKTFSNLNENYLTPQID